MSTGKPKDPSRFIEKATEYADWITDSFLKYFVTGTGVLVIALSITSVIYFWLRLGYVPIGQLYKPYKIT